MTEHNLQADHLLKGPPMSLRRLSRYAVFSGVLVLPMFFQNCGVAFNTLDTVDLNSSFARYASELKSVGITCQNPSLVSPTDSRRLSRIELVNSLKNLVGGALYAKVEPSVMSLTNDDIQRDPRNFPTSFDSNQLETIDRVSRQLGIYVSSNDEDLRTLAGDCGLASPVSDACINSFISSFGRRAFRRPLTAEDVNFFKGIYSAAGAGKAGISAVVSAAVIAPEFLYHIEVGTPGVGTNTQFTITNHELASRVSYMLTDGPPDAELAAKADDGTIRDSVVLSAQVDRLLTGAMGRNKVHRFFSYWLMLETFQGIPTNGNYLAGINTSGLTAEMTRELHQFIDYIVYEKRGSYVDLLTSRKSFAQSQALASIYGHAPVANGQMADMAPTHMGLLLRSPVLANPTNQTHPILRGVFMHRRILCNDIASPSPADLVERTSAMFVPDPVRDSTAIQTAKQTASNTCMACHSQINPMGFALEGYDNLGRARTTDKIFDTNGNFIAEHPVRISGAVYLGRSPASQITSGPELVSGIAGGATGPACFTKQMHRFYKMQREVASDGCVLATGFSALQDPGGSIYSAIKNSIVNAYTDKKRIQ